MKIQAVNIDGFKNLSNVHIKFDKITALVSLNNFGKSNLLNAIDFGLDFIKSSTENKEELMAISDLMPINKYSLKKNFKFEMELLTEFQGIEYRIIYGYEFAWKYSSEKDASIVYEELKARPNEKGTKYTYYIKRSAQGALYKSSETGRCTSKINIEGSELIVNKLKAYDSLFYYQIIKKLNSLKFYMETNFNTENFYRPDPIIRKGLEDTPVDSDNLPRVIYQLQENDPDKFILLKEIFKDLFPDVKDIIVKQHKFKLDDDMENLPEDFPYTITNSIYRLYVIDNNLVGPIDFLAMSDGAKRIFMILTRIILANISNVSLIAIEEPENSIHPNLFHAFIQIITQLLDDCKVIITSHSPYIITYLNPGCIYIGINKKPGVAEFFAFKSSGQRMLQKEATDLDMSMGDYLFSMLSDSNIDWSEYLECDVNG